MEKSTFHFLFQNKREEKDRCHTWDFCEERILISRFMEIYCRVYCQFERNLMSHLQGSLCHYMKETTPSCRLRQEEPSLSTSMRRWPQADLSSQDTGVPTVLAVLPACRLSRVHCPCVVSVHNSGFFKATPLSQLPGRYFQRQSCHWGERNVSSPAFLTRALFCGRSTGCCACPLALTYPLTRKSGVFDGHIIPPSPLGWQGD